MFDRARVTEKTLASFKADTVVGVQRAEKELLLVGLRKTHEHTHTNTKLR